MSRWISCHRTTESGMVPIDQTHRDFTPAMTVKVHVDAAISVAMRGAPKDARESLERLTLATNALRGVGSPRITESWKNAIGRVEDAIIGAYGLAA